MTAAATSSVPVPPPPELGAWYPIAAASDIVERHVYATTLLGRELAVWRADDGHVNVWEDRCLHRGVHLSIGTNNGSELVCRYHGWRYTSRTAECTYIPAHPADAPPRTVCNVVLPAVESCGLVWSGGSPAGEPPHLTAADVVVLRGITMPAPLGAVEARLAEIAEATDTPVDRELHWFLQPNDAWSTTVRGVVLGDSRLDREVEHDLLWRASRACERVAVDLTASCPAVAPTWTPAALARPSSVELPARRGSGRSMVVVANTDAGGDASMLRLAPIDGVELDAAQPGAHIDLHLPALGHGPTARQYSLLNGPGDRTSYDICVKREPAGRGGSVFVNDSVREGDLIRVSGPRNGFVLRRDAADTVLIAGGIGITPIVSMARHLAADGAPFTVHHFVRDLDDRPLAHHVDALGAEVRGGLTPEATESALRTILDPDHGITGRQVYVCGPPPMIEATRAIATELGWPERSVHAEFFSNPNDVDMSSSFQLHLARSAMTLTVQTGESVLSVLEGAGVMVDSSCRTGACGTCVVPLVDGDVEHNDVYLSDDERTRNVATCVSRAMPGSRMVLDL